MIIYIKLQAGIFPVVIRINHVASATQQKNSAEKSQKKNVHAKRNQKKSKCPSV